MYCRMVSKCYLISSTLSAYSQSLHRVLALFFNAEHDSPDGCCEATITSIARISIGHQSSSSQPSESGAQAAQVELRALHRLSETPDKALVALADGSCKAALWKGRCGQCTSVLALEVILRGVDLVA